jgi:hypothetical protein
MLKNLTKLIATAALALLVTSPAHGQAARADASKPSFDDLQSPQIGGREKSFRPRDWLEMEAKIKIDVRPEPPSGMADRLTVKWYVAIKNPERRGEFLLLTREVNHVNVPIGEDVYTSVYLSPSSIRRITGNFRGGKGSVEFVGYEVVYNGEVVGHATNKGQDQWWNIPSERISASDTVPLLTKPETPFAAMWWDRYAEVAVERGGGS